MRAPKMSVCACLSFRVDISDTLMYVYEMLGAELLSNLYDKLGRLLTNAEQPTSWQVGETYTDEQRENVNYFLFILVLHRSHFWTCVILDLTNQFFNTGAFSLLFFT